MRCECCQRTRDQLIRDQFATDYRQRDGVLSRYIVCRSCQALNDNDFFRLLDMDKWMPFGDWLAQFEDIDRIADIQMYFDEKTAQEVT